MSDCCSADSDINRGNRDDARELAHGCCSQKTPKKHVCPNDGVQYVEVDYKTVLHHIKKPWAMSIKQQAYYFCSNPECEIVYFGLDNSTIMKSQLRTRVGVKEADDALICYCFQVLKSDAKENKAIKHYVAQQTKNGTCSCATFNPSGKCCLKDFPNQA